MKIVLEAIIETIASRVDGTVIIKIGTQELDSSKAGELFQLRGKFVKCLISDSNITKLEEELIDSTRLVSGKKNKSESQRLRAVMFLIHEKSETTQDFDSFYKQEMEKIISHFKLKLD